MAASFRQGLFAQVIDHAGENEEKYPQQDHPGHGVRHFSPCQNTRINMKGNLTHERLLQVIDYDLSTGLMIWKHQLAGRGKIGTIAGCLGGGGYWLIAVDNVLYLAHRLAWFYVFGMWPKRLDHKDGVRTNNRIDNLREATVSQNGANKKLQVNNTSGFKAIRARPNRAGVLRWQARIEIMKDGKRKNITIGTFDTSELACQAYQRAAEQYFGEFARVA